MRALIQRVTEASVTIEDEIVGKIAIADDRKPLTDTVDVFRQNRVDVILAATGLLHVGVVLRAELDLLGFADKSNFALAGDRINSAGRERKGHCSNNYESY